MTLKLTTACFLLLLSACGTRSVQIANSRCWSLHPGDRVSGNVIVVSIGYDGLTEGGTFIENSACPKKVLGVNIPDGPLLERFRRVMAYGSPQFVERRFSLSGHVYKNRGSDQLLVAVESLRPLP